MDMQALSSVVEGGTGAILREALDLEAEELDRLVGEDARLHLGGEYLLVGSANFFEVREGEAAAAPP